MDRIIPQSDNFGPQIAILIVDLLKMFSLFLLKRQFLAIKSARICNHKILFSLHSRIVCFFSSSMRYFHVKYLSQSCDSFFSLFRVLL